MRNSYPLLSCSLPWMQSWCLISLSVQYVEWEIRLRRDKGVCYLLVFLLRSLFYFAPSLWGYVQVEVKPRMSLNNCSPAAATATYITRIPLSVEPCSRIHWQAFSCAQSFHHSITSSDPSTSSSVSYTFVTSARDALMRFFFSSYNHQSSLGDGAVWKSHYYSLSVNRVLGLGYNKMLILG